MDIKNNLDSLDLENMFNLTIPINSNVIPRWKRKEFDRNTSALKVQSSPKKARLGPIPSVSNYSDRFLPNRQTMNIEVSQYQVKNQLSNEIGEKSNNDDFKTILAENLGIAGIEKTGDQQVILSFKGKAPKHSPFFLNGRLLYTDNQLKETDPHLPRELPNSPDKILDAPEMIDDYYLNVLDWSDNNILAVALNNSLYLLNASTGKIDELVTLPLHDDYISSVKYMKHGSNILALGLNSKVVQLYDIEKSKLIRTMNGHQHRISSLDWNKHILSSGSRDTNIILHDVRIPKSIQNVLNFHTQEVCSLKWNGELNYLASGSNDNLVNIWDIRNTSTLYTFKDHIAAVKALAWCPYQKNILASGAGAADRNIKIWNINHGKLINSIDTGSQVCSLLWNPHEKELLSSHGYSQNQLSLWSYPSMTKIRDFLGHTSRVLYLSLSPDGQTVCSGAADETLRLWKIFHKQSIQSTKGFGDFMSGRKITCLR